MQNSHRKHENISIMICIIGARQIENRNKKTEKIDAHDVISLYRSNEYLRKKGNQLLLF